MRNSVVAALGLVISAAAPGAGAANPHPVDPDAMTPQLNPSFAPWSCFEVGTGIRCRGGHDEAYAGQTDLECAGRAVYVDGSERVVMTRWHDLEGRAMAGELHTDVDDHLSLSPTGAGPSVTLAGHWQKHYVYPVPGSPDDRLLTETGSVVRVTAPGVGVLFHDAGTVTYQAGGEYEVVTRMHGVHDRFGGSTDLEDAICAGLTGP